MNKLELIISPTEKVREWKVFQEVAYKEVIVPVGFCFDGASIPLGFRWLFPHGGAKMLGACVHDACYRDVEHKGVSKETADKYFLELMLYKNVVKWRAVAMYQAVTLFGMKAWEEEYK